MPGEGDPNADVMFVGEGPGSNEDKSGRPFVGRAGEILDRVIQNCLGMERKDVFITNVVKCRPPDNRNPELFESMACAGYLDEQIIAVNPKVIVTLGKVAAYHLCTRTLSLKESMSYFRMSNDGVNETSIPRYIGSSYTGEDKTFPLVATWHPAYILRQGIQSQAAFDVRDDMEFVKNALQRSE